MNFAQVCGVVTCAVMAVAGCEGDREETTSSVEGASTTAQCSAVKITSPMNTSRRSIDTPITLRAEVTCPSGVVGETQFWVKPNGARTWTKLPGYTTAETTWTPSREGAWNVTAVAHAVGSSAWRDVRAPSITILVSQRGAPSAERDSATTPMSTATILDLVANDDDPDGDPLVVTGFTQGAHGRVTLSGSSATYTPRPGFVGSDKFRYTVSDGNGHSSTAKVDVVVTAVEPECSITISGPAIAVIGPPVRLTATASCNVGPAEIQWLHRVPNFAFSVFKNFSLATTADFSTRRAATGLHFFVARVRAQGTEEMFWSNVVTTTFTREQSPCTAVALDSPANGSLFPSNTAIALQATATCPSGVTAEYQFRARVPNAPAWTTLGAYGANSASFTPPDDGNWELSAVARAVGSTAPFQAESAVVSVSVNDAPQANDDTLTIDEDHAGSVNVLANDVDANGDTLTATITGDPDSGTATISAGVVTYTPAPDYHGSDSLSYTVNDGHGHTATATLNITINPVNDGPAAIHDSLVAIEDTASSIDVTLNDLDVDGDTLVVTDIHPPDHGTASFEGTVVTYAPDGNYNGPDSFQYTISDGHGGLSTATVFVEVLAVNDTPVAVDDDLTTPEDADGGVFLVGNDIDPDGETPTVVSFEQPAHGTVSVVAGLASYQPNHNYNGPDAFTYTIADAAGLESTATVHITVLPVNDAPVASNDSAELEEDTSAEIDVVANDSDVDGDTLAIASVGQPGHGTAVIASGHVVEYTPDADFSGTDTFSYTIGDPSGAQATATVTVTVGNVNDAPDVAADSASTDEDTAVTINVVGNDTDADGDALAIASVTQPEHGIAAIVDATRVSYTPAGNYHGPDTFTYTVGDGHGGEATAEVAVTVISVNDAPVAVDDAATTNEDSPATIDVVGNDSDADGDTLAITAVTQPAHGVAEVIDGHRVAYTPAPNYDGGDAFTYTIADGNDGTSTATVTLVVNPVNDAPVAQADSASLFEDTFTAIDVVGNDVDVDGDALAIASFTQPAAGVVTLLDAHRVVYTPAPNFHGSDAFTYTIADPSGVQATAAVAVLVIGVNDAPLAHADTAILDEDGAASVDVVANDFDIDGDDLAITSITQPAHGIATVTDAHRVLYVPAPDFHGADSLSYTISDGHGGISIATLALTVNSVNDGPAAIHDSLVATEDTAAPIDPTLNDLDVDGDSLTVTDIHPPEHGTATFAGNVVTYTPAANYNGADSFEYTISDGHGGLSTATVFVEVQAVNDTPVAVNDAASLNEDASATVDVVANDSDVDNDDLAVATITQPAHGTASIADARRVTYTPAANYHGPDSLQYTIADGHGGQATATLALDVISVNDAPVAAAGAASTFDDTPIEITLSASDVEGDALTFAIASGPANGTLGALAGNRVTYTPALAFVGGDSFTFTASDGASTSAPAAVAITVIQSVCGNAAREGVHEECDDGNATPSDGCESNCRLTCGSGTGADRSTVDAASGHCFAAYDGVSHGYQDAAALCAGFGGHLPTIGSAGEDDAAAAAVHAGDTPWLGGDDIAAEATFRWTTGEAFDYTNFAVGKPDNAGNADCLRYLADGTWTDASCGANVSGTLCEFELAVGTPHFATGGSGTRGVAVADFNGDGHADAAATNQSSNTVGVLFGNGTGSFALQGTYPTGSGPTAVAAGDFDNDGDVDLAVVNGGANSLGVLLGSPSGTFTAGTTFAIASGAAALTAGDFNQDGNLDLAIAANGTAQTWRGNGSGGFTAGPSIGLGLGALGASIAAGDFNGDGRLDLAVATQLAVLVVLSNGPGTFGLPTSIALSLANRSVVVTDLDGDGLLDLAVANGVATVSLFFGNPLGLFLTPVTLSVAGTPQVVATGDFDGDGGSDVVALTANFATLFHGAGRQFTPAGAVIATGGGASFAATASLNGDAARDLVVANPATSSAAVVLGGAGGFAGARALAVGTGTSSTLTADFNQDGRADLAVFDPQGSRVYVYVQGAGGALTQSAMISTINNAGPTYGAVADFDGDGKLDLAIVNVTFSSLNVVLGNGTGGFSPPLPQTGVGQGPGRPAVGDFNGDGRPDLAVPATIANRLTILVNTGGGRFGAAPDVTMAAGPSAVAIADFNADDKRDLAVVTTGEASVKVLLGNGASGFGAPATFAIASGSQSIAAADLDGDGKVDLAATNTAASSVSVLLGLGNGSFAAAASVSAGAQPSSVTAADLDGDTRLDLVVSNAGSGDVSLLHNNGLGGFAAYRVAVGAAPSWVTVADLDHDGHPDLAASSGNPFTALLYSAR
jgi:cysteine-rich repeat protein